MSQLKRALEPNVVIQEIPQSLTKEMEWNIKPLKIKGVRQSPAESSGKIYLDEDSRELAYNIMCQFPNFHLEDQVDSEGGGIDTNPISHM